MNLNCKSEKGTYIDKTSCNINDKYCILRSNRQRIKLQKNKSKKDAKQLDLKELVLKLSDQDLRSIGIECG